jgi:hypothetical protein
MRLKSNASLHNATKLPRSFVSTSASQSQYFIFVIELLTMANLESARDAIYQQVPLVSGDIRLIKLLPGKFKDPLRLELSLVSFATDPYYEALSYTWGATTKGYKVTVNGSLDFSVTDNLFLALRRLRPRKAPRILWVDAICINRGTLQKRMSRYARWIRSIRRPPV